jgi:hypothetical protein
MLNGLPTPAAYVVAFLLNKYTGVVIDAFSGEELLA